MFSQYIRYAMLLLLLSGGTIIVTCSGEQQQNAQTKPDAVTSLNGKSFAIELWENDKSAGPDTVVFYENTCQSSQCLQYGFAESAYSVKPEGNGIRWVSTVASETEGKIYWNGLITGDKIEGTMAWEKEGQATINYKFSGSAL